MGGFLHLPVGIISPPPFKSSHNVHPISRREIDGYKVPSAYTTNFLCVHYKILGSHNIFLGFTTHISIGHFEQAWEMKCHNSFGGDSATESIIRALKFSSISKDLWKLMNDRSSSVAAFFSCSSVSPRGLRFQM